MYMRNIADIIPNGSDICSTADIAELSAIVNFLGENLVRY